MRILDIRVRTEARSVTYVQSCVSAIAKEYGLKDLDASKLCVAVEEAMMNVIENAPPKSDADAWFDIGIDIGDMDIELSIKDRGRPLDLQTIREDDDSECMNLKLMRGLTDGVALSNLGGAGREQRIIKRFESLPSYERRVPEDRAEFSENIEFRFHDLRENDAIEVAQCVYDEFGYTYQNDTVYYPDKFYAACTRKDYCSMVASAPNGEVAGHLALIFDKRLPGIAEMGIGVVKHKYRNYSVMKNLTSSILKRGEEDYDLNAVFAQCLMWHTITQKISLKNGLVPCGFFFQYCSDEMRNNFNGSNTRGNVALAIRSFHDIVRDDHVPEEIHDIFSTVIEGLGLNRAVLPGIEPAQNTTSEIYAVTNRNLRVGKIFIDNVGSDLEYKIKDSMRMIKKEGCAVCEMYICMSDPGATYAYHCAKDSDFFCTGILPCTEKGDMIIMECLFSQVPDYGAMETIGAFTELLDKVKKLDPYG